MIVYCLIADRNGSLYTGFEGAFALMYLSTSLNALSFFA